MNPDQTIPSTSGKLAASATATFSGIEASILLGGEGAPMTVMAMQVSPDQGAPAHISFEEDKLFLITEGQFEFLIGDDRLSASAGDHVFVGRGIVHGFVALAAAPARMTLMSTPARHDRFFMAMGQLPVPHDRDQVEDICHQYRQAIVGPVISVEIGTKSQT
ncbi:cupin domain-containing protein [Novosphingobium rosa]|uniref:cupin domain-containing protein n=1 Tax=Novosphingobium rosa TaxID=76978 RepID=UPI0008346D13|nr:cupin domain-containing protein [Novosphingobium rosa]